MEIGVFTLAQEDTRLGKKSVHEVAGPCPNPDCDRKTDGFIVRFDKNGGKGGFMCRGCWDPKQPPIRPDKPRWGDGIDYLRHVRRMRYSEAKAHIDRLNGDVDAVLERVERAQSWYDSQPELCKNEALQERYQDYIREAIKRLWETSEGKACLDFLRARGLHEDTIREAQLGCIDTETLRRKKLARVEVDTQFILIPWYADKLLWRVQLRDIRPDVPPDERYRNFPKSSNGLYLGDCLKKKRATFLVEGEIDALSIAQEAGNLVNVVATGSTDGGHTPKWESRLARVPAVLVAFDRTPDGDEKAQDWLHILNGATVVHRWKPLVKDANEMLKQGYSIKTWVQAALDYISEDQDQQQDDFRCSKCGLDLNTSAQEGHIDLNGVAFCSEHWQSLQSSTEPQSSPSWSSQEQFLSTVQTIASRLESSTGVAWQVLPVEQAEPQPDVTGHDQQSSKGKRSAWQPSRRVKVNASIPRWLVPGTNEWKEHIDFLSLGPKQFREEMKALDLRPQMTQAEATQEMLERHQAWLAQAKAS